MRTIIYGQAPGRTGDPKHPLTGGGVGDMLAWLCGVTVEELQQIFVLRNVLNYYPGRANGKGDLFPIDEAQKAASKIRPSFREDDRIVLLGRNVGRAFGLSDLLYLVWTPLGRAQAVMIPHPSHVNIYYNNEQNKNAVASILEALVQEFADAR